MTENEILELEGGGWLSAAGAFFGGILFAATPAVCVGLGPGAGAGVFTLGCTLLDLACDNVD